MKYSLAAAVAALLLIPAVAGAVDYPAPKDPGKLPPKPKGPFKTYTVCKKKKRCDFRTIQKAVNKAKAGDKIKVANGVYREQVLITGRKKRYLRIVGNPGHPRKVVLEGANKKQNGFFINSADQVTVNGFFARNYKSNGFFVTNSTGYKFTHLVAMKGGVYGIYAFNSKGGEMSHSESYYNSDAGYYIGQTPHQDKPIRSVVRDVKSWGNPIGFSGTNMRYVTITGSSFYNNGVGIVPNADDGEKFPPPEDNVITGNKIFWNNFDFHQGTPPFKIKNSGVVPLVPPGSGVLLIGGRGTRVEDNDIFGNYLTGVAALESILLDNEQTRTLSDTQVRGNRFGLGGTDLNGHDITYDGNGTGNCWGPNEGVQVAWPGDASMYPACPFTGANAYSSDAFSQLAALVGENGLKGWVKHPHSTQPGITPLEVYEK